MRSQHSCSKFIHRFWRFPDQLLYWVGILNRSGGRHVALFEQMPDMEGKKHAGNCETKTLFTANNNMRRERRNGISETRCGDNVNSFESFHGSTIVEIWYLLEIFLNAQTETFDCTSSFVLLEIASGNDKNFREFERKIHLIGGKGRSESSVTTSTSFTFNWNSTQTKSTAIIVIDRRFN